MTQLLDHQLQMFDPLASRAAHRTVERGPVDETRALLQVVSALHPEPR
jgi:hypothetical protein